MKVSEAEVMLALNKSLQNYETQVVVKEKKQEQKYSQYLIKIILDMVQHQQVNLLLLEHRLKLPVEMFS
jgi:hypothetical protein